MVLIPVHVLKWTGNKFIGVVENLVLKTTLPINVTDIGGFPDGPKVTELPSVRKTIIEFLKELRNVLDR